MFDLHVHVWNAERSIAEYAEQARVAGLAVTGFGGIHMAVRGKVAETRSKNDALITLATRHSGMVAIPSVHPYDGDAALTEVDRLAALGVRILKLHPHTQNFDAADPRVKAVCEAAGRHGIVVLIDNANIVVGDNQKLFNLALAVPGTRFVFAHLGGTEFRFWNLIPVLRTTEGFFSDNIYFDISGMVNLFAGSPMEAEYVWTLRSIGTDRILFGSDWPQFGLAEGLRSLDRLPLTPAEKDRIRWGNASALLLGERPPPPRPQPRRPFVQQVP